MAREASALERARQFIDGGGRVEVTGVPVGFAYYAIPLDVKPDRRAILHADLHRRGYAKADGIAISNLPGAEVWTAPAEVAALLRANRAKRAAAQLKLVQAPKPSLADRVTAQVIASLDRVTES